MRWPAQSNYRLKAEDVGSTDLKLQNHKVTQLLYVIAMVAVIVGVDVLFFRNHFWERLLVNVGIVMVFAAFYLRFLKPP